MSTEEISMMLCSVSTSVLDDPDYLSPAQMSQLEDEYQDYLRDLEIDQQPLTFERWIES